MENFKFALFSIIILSLLVFVGYWGFSSIESGSSHTDNQEFKNIINENKDLKKQVKELLGQIKVLQIKIDEQSQATKDIEKKIAEEKTVNKTKTYKYQSLINDLQKLINDRIYMKKGSKGTRVGVIQKFLNIYNKTSKRIDNSYGPTTVSLIRSFQKKQGLTSDGQAGVGTFRSMISWLKK